MSHLSYLEKVQKLLLQDRLWLIYHQQKLLSAQKEGGIELLTAQEREVARERNETNELQHQLSLSYKKTQAAVES